MVQIWTKLMYIWMFWGSFVNNLDFGFGSIGISMVCGDWVIIDQNFDGRDSGNFDSGGKG